LSRGYDYVLQIIFFDTNALAFKALKALRGLRALAEE
jgi:hypothetical protein